MTAYDCVDWDKREKARARDASRALGTCFFFLGFSMLSVFIVILTTAITSRAGVSIKVEMHTMRPLSQSLRLEGRGAVAQ
jgi:hypothetical protein